MSILTILTAFLSISSLLAAPAPLSLCDTAQPGPINDKLIVNLNSNGAPNIWSSTDRQQLTYCISNNFGNLKSTMVRAFDDSVKAWQRHANVRFIYMRRQDSTCNDSNRNVLFRVNMFNDPNSSLAGRAFFPYASASRRKIIINKRFIEGSNRLLLWLVKHELGHVLGFRHEHIHSQNNGKCSEGGRYNYLTSYDRHSVMHYQQCNGVGPRSSLSRLDKRGAALIYP